MVVFDPRHTRSALSRDGWWCTLPFMKLIDFRHIAKQNVLLVLQVAGKEVRQGRVLHLCRIAL